VRLKVVRIHELDRMRGHQRQRKLTGQIGRLLNDGLLLRLAVALHFKIERPRENNRPSLGTLAGQIKIAVQQSLADIAQMRAGQRYQTIAAQFAKPFAANFSPVAPALDQISLAQQLAQLLVADTIACQQQQAIGVVRRIRVGDPHIRPGNRLDPFATRPGVELDQPEQVAEIGHRHRRHAVARRALDSVANADDAVGDGVFGMEAKVDVARGVHGRHFTAGNAARLCLLSQAGTLA
jgi:hypothetical protein